MSSEFARRMEVEAEKIAEPFQDYIHGVKCWDSTTRLFDQGATRALITTHPGGGEEAHLQDLCKGYLHIPYTNQDFNAYLDEGWEGSPPGKHSGQTSVQRVFEAMYGDAWEKTFRNTACFKVLPFRIRNIKALPSKAQCATTPWFQEVLEHVKPRLIICNGNMENGLSPWSIIRKIYSIEKENTNEIHMAV